MTESKARPPNSTASIYTLSLPTSAEHSNVNGLHATDSASKNGVRNAINYAGQPQNPIYYEPYNPWIFYMETTSAPPPPYPHHAQQRAGKRCSSMQHVQEQMSLAQQQMEQAAQQLQKANLYQREREGQAHRRIEDAQKHAKHARKAASRYGHEMRKDARQRSEQNMTSTIASSYTTSITDANGNITSVTSLQYHGYNNAYAPSPSWVDLSDSEADWGFDAEQETQTWGAKMETDAAYRGRRMYA